MKNMINLKDCSSEELLALIDVASHVKQHPRNYGHMMIEKTLLMIFEKPSLRTRISFETGAYQLGGHAIYYDMSTSPMGAGKESIADSVRVISRFNDIIMARLNKHEDLLEMAEYATVPVVNALTDFSHPCQVLADLLTISEHKGELKGLKLAYLGDANNNVTHSLLFGCAQCGIDIAVACPDDPGLKTAESVLEDARAIAAENGTQVEMVFDAEAAAEGADVVYTDSWMSYHIPKEKQDEREEKLRPYQVNGELMKSAKDDAIFMNCLPALRGCEQTAEVIDGPQSVVFDEAENRLYAQKAVMIDLLQGI